MQPLGIALIGYGGIGRVHAMAYRDLPFHYGLPADTIRLVGVATTRRETAERAAREIGCSVWTDDYRTLLGRDDVQAVDICVPNFWHEEIVSAAAQAGKHIYCEKPLAMDAAQAWRMVQAVEEAEVKGQVCFNFRFAPSVLRARQLVDEGFTGKLFSFRGWYHRASYISAQKPLSWRLSREVSGGGALFDLGSHVLDLVQYLAGDVGQVLATLETRITERPLAGDPAQRGRVDVDDLALLQLRLTDGTPGTVEASRLATGAVNDLMVELFGDQGALRLDLGDPNWLYVYDVRNPDKPLGGQRGFTRIETVQRFAGQLAPDWTQAMSFVRGHAESQYQFLRAIWDNRPAQPDLRAAAQLQEIMEAAQVSAQAGRWVSLSELAAVRKVASTGPGERAMNTSSGDREGQDRA